MDLAGMASLSIILTVENIFLVFLASLLMFLIKDVTLNTSRGFDDDNRQLKAMAIGAFKEKFDDVKMRDNRKKMSQNKPMHRRLHMNNKAHGLKGALLRANTTVRLPGVSVERTSTISRYDSEMRDLHGCTSDFTTDEDSEDDGPGGAGD